MSDNAVELLRHALGITAQLGEDATAELLGRIDAIVRAARAARTHVRARPASAPRTATPQRPECQAELRRLIEHGREVSA